MSDEKRKRPRRPQDWTATEKQEAVLKAAALSDEQLGSFLRREGLHQADLERWRQQMLEGLEEKPKRGRSAKSVEARRIRELEKELRHKDAALAETAALLILKKIPGDLGGRGRRHTAQERQVIFDLVEETVESGASQGPACQVLGLTARILQRWRRAKGAEDRRQGPKSEPPNKLSKKERQRVLDLVNAPENRDLSPNQIVPRLADKGLYLASESTLYRMLREENLMTHRGRSRPVNARRPAAHVATRANQVFSWNITYLYSPVRGRFFYLYLILDVWSRKIMGARVYSEESMELAAELFKDTCLRHDLDAQGIVLHSDNGGPMKGSTMLATLQGLGVVASFSRPGVSDDNPYSEALFRTLKYRPEYPSGPFTSLDAASLWVEDFVSWYNTVHLHSGIRFVTPDDRHSGRDREILYKRRKVYELARGQNPQRWSRKIRDWKPIDMVYLNPEKAIDETTRLQEVA